jgi:hypothetical protein
LLYKINAKMPLEATKIEISRKGVKKNTRWTVIALGPVDAKALEQIEKVKLNILHREPSEETAPAASDDSSEIPF